MQKFKTFLLERLIGKGMSPEEIYISDHAVLVNMPNKIIYLTRAHSS